ncbi:phosphotransferase [Jatrophihabitans sp. YIM 134969]
MTVDPLAWADAALARLDRARTGEPEVEADQPWGRVLRLPTADGPVWLKQPAPAMRFELALLRTLGGLTPRLTPEVLMDSPADGLVLLADAGTRFSDAYDDDDLPARFAAVLVEVGRVQRASMPLVDDLAAAGVPDLRVTHALDRFDELVSTLGDGVLSNPASARNALERLVGGLNASAVPAAVEHNDLHDGNVLVDADGRVTVIDWGDSVVTHPFAVLLVVQRVLASLLDDAPLTHPLIVRARRDYLAGFADLAPGEDLEHTARAAVLVAHLGRAVAWQRALTAFARTGRDPGEFADAAREWLRRGARAWRAALFDGAEPFSEPP